jgi:3-hydroxymyristoyl/3-hydroxydecanoyl-(acyl carrier protein) dehydratase
MGTPIDHIPHRLPFGPPWRLIDRVLEVAGDRVRAERRLSANDPLLRDGLPELLALEALAQTAACLNAGELGIHRGYLVAASDFQFDGRAQPGETLSLEATRQAQMGALLRFQGEARAITADGSARVVARGQMTFAVEKSAP